VLLSSGGVFRGAFEPARGLAAVDGGAATAVAVADEAAGASTEVTLATA